MHQLRPGYYTKLNLMVRFQSWSFRECGVPHHFHNSQVHFEPEWKYLLGSHLWVKKNCLIIYYTFIYDLYVVDNCLLTSGIIVLKKRTIVYAVNEQNFSLQTETNPGMNKRPPPIVSEWDFPLPTRMLFSRQINSTI